MQNGHTNQGIIHVLGGPARTHAGWPGSRGVEAGQAGTGPVRRESRDVSSLTPPTTAGGKWLGARVEIAAEGLWAVALGENIERMGASVETAIPHLGLSESRLLHAAEWQKVHTARRADRGKLATQMWVRKDAALQLLGYGLEVDPGCIDASHSGDRGRVRLEHPDGVVSSVHVTDVRLSDDHVCAIATWHRPEEVRYWGDDPARAGLDTSLKNWAAV